MKLRSITLDIDADDRWEVEVSNIERWVTCDGKSHQTETEAKDHTRSIIDKKRRYEKLVNVATHEELGKIFSKNDIAIIGNTDRYIKKIQHRVDKQYTLRDLYGSYQPYVANTLASISQQIISTYADYSTDMIYASQLTCNFDE